MLTQIKAHLLFLTLVIYCALVIPVSAKQQGDTNQQPITIIEPTKKITKVKHAQIDTEKFEIGGYFGSISIPDFSANTLTGLSFSYHVNSKIFTQLSYAKSNISNATFEDVINKNFLHEKDREFSTSQLIGGYRLFDGRSFLSSSHKYSSRIYILAGIENIIFAGKEKIGITLGSNYKVVITDWLTLDINFKDHIFEREFLFDKKLTNNLEFSIGFNALF